MTALVSLSEIALVAPAAVAAAIAYSAGRARTGNQHDSLDRELMRRRRREEPAALLLLEGRCDAAAAMALKDALRVTDTVDCRYRRGHVRLRALVDVASLDQAAVERRLTAVGGVELSAGWAIFPEDGLTLGTIVEAAADRLSALPPVSVVEPIESVPRVRPAEQAAS